MLPRKFRNKNNLINSPEKSKDNIFSDHLNLNNIITTKLWCNSELIPFYETDSFKELKNWFNKWPLLGKSCLLYGDLSSGKSRLIETLSLENNLHIYEVDFTLSKNINKSFEKATESTQSHSVTSIYGSPSNKTNQFNSIVIFEHLDSFFIKKNSYLNSLINFCNNSKIPIIMTSNCLFSNNFSDCKIIKVIPPPYPIKLLSTSLWIKSFPNQKTILTSIQSFLHLTEFDLRKTSLQMMINLSTSDILSLEEYSYLSLPYFIQEKEKIEQISYYSSLIDCFSLNFDDNFFLNYSKPINFRLFSLKQEKEILEKINLIKFYYPNSNNIDIFHYKILFKEYIKNSKFDFKENDIKKLENLSFF